MDGCDLSQTKILDAQRPGYSGNLGHQSVQINVCTVGAAQKPLELGLRADEIAVLTPLNERPTPRNSPSAAQESSRLLSPPSLNCQTCLPPVIKASSKLHWRAARTMFVLKCKDKPANWASKG
jgi:hypothetical protein